jgi:hypothetical protein
MKIKSNPGIGTVPELTVLHSQLFLLESKTIHFNTNNSQLAGTNAKWEIN